MYKNNYISATFDDICAHIIQSSWKNYKIREINKQSYGMVEVIYTSITGSNNSISTKMEQIENILTLTNSPFRIYNLLDYKDLKVVVEVNILF